MTSVVLSALSVNSTLPALAFDGLHKNHLYISCPCFAPVSVPHTRYLVDFFVHILSWCLELLTGILLSFCPLKSKIMVQRVSSHHRANQILRPDSVSPHHRANQNLRPRQRHDRNSVPSTLKTLELEIFSCITRLCLWTIHHFL